MLSILTRWRPPMLMQCSRKHKTDFFSSSSQFLSHFTRFVWQFENVCSLPQIQFFTADCCLFCISYRFQSLFSRAYTHSVHFNFEKFSDWWTLSSHHKRVRLHYLFMMSMMDEISAFLNVPSSSLPACLQLQHDLRPQHISLLHCWFRSFSVIILIFHVFCFHFETQRHQSLLAVSCWACIDIKKRSVDRLSCGDFIDAFFLHTTVTAVSCRLDALHDYVFSSRIFFTPLRYIVTDKKALVVARVNSYWNVIKFHRRSTFNFPLRAMLES